MSESIITEFEAIIASKAPIAEADKRSDLAKKAYLLIKEKPDGLTSIISNLLTVLFPEGFEISTDDITDPFLADAPFFLLHKPQKSDDITDNVKKTNFRILNNYYLREERALPLLLRYYLANYEVLGNVAFEERLFARFGADSQNLFDYVLGKFAENQATSERAQQLYARYLTTATLTPEKFREIALSAAKHALLSDKIFRVDSLLGALKKRTDDATVPAPVLRALEAFARGRYNEYVAATNDVTDDANLKFLVEQKIFDKMKILTVTSVCAAAGAGAVVTFKAFAEELGIGEDDVEDWVIKAIGAKLVTGKINQIEKCVSVMGVSQRVFGKEEWASLEKMLGEWKENVTAINKLAEDQKQEFSQLIMKKKEVNK